MSRAYLLGAMLMVLAPSFAHAQSDPACLRDKRADEVAGGLVGAAVGAIVGAVASHGGTAATVGGGVGGAAAGALVAHTTVHCGQNRYGYYDDRGEWVSYRATDDGYVGPDGQWVAQTPPSPDPGDTRAREIRMQSALERRLDEGGLTRDQGRRALRSLSEISAIDADYRSDDGRLTPAQHQDIEGRLDGLARATGLAEEQ
ncbi:MAG: hypothetical protein JO111_12800 [Caulobacteraceae bacterium]|nr:hypothetical protein [Caulobacteraceae bacterium]